MARNLHLWGYPTDVTLQLAITEKQKIQIYITDLAKIQPGPPVGGAVINQLIIPIYKMDLQERIWMTIDEAQRLLGL